MPDLTAKVSFGGGQGKINWGNFDGSGYKLGGEIGGRVEREGDIRRLGQGQQKTKKKSSRVIINQ